MTKDTHGLPAGWGEALARVSGTAPAQPPAQAQTSDGAIGVYLPRWNKKRTLRFLSLRAWQRQTHTADIEQFKRRKRAVDEVLARLAADEIAGALLDMGKHYGRAVVTTPPRGHGKTSVYFAGLVGRLVAERLACPFEALFVDRHLKGSSHPRTWAERGELVLTREPTAPLVILVDDVATSGTTLETCAAVLGAYAFVLPVAWVYENASRGAGGELAALLSALGGE
jgi:predicted amidophosphoribosyltransferase